MRRLWGGLALPEALRQGLAGGWRLLSQHISQPHARARPSLALLPLRRLYEQVDPSLDFSAIYAAVYSSGKKGQGGAPGAE